ncbi:MAG: GcrA family cell cycle regulator [Stellaceae bacterium]
MSVTWTPALDADLVRLITVERRTREAAGTILGVGKNAVVGRCNRLGIVGNQLPSDAVVERRRLLAQATRQSIPLGPMAKTAPRPAGAHMASYSGKGFPPFGCCVWPMWPDADPPSLEFCGEPCDGGPYCTAHTKMASGGRPAVSGRPFPLSDLTGWR